LGVIGRPFAHWLTAITIAATSTAQDSPQPILGSLPVVGGQLHYEIRGDGAPIVLLSGGPGFGNYLQAVADALAPDLRCILFDQRGCGASQWEKPGPKRSRSPTPSPIWRRCVST